MLEQIDLDIGLDLILKWSLNIVVDDYVKIVKVAVAVAVIQNKPEGTSAYEYSRQLCGRCFSYSFFIHLENLNVKLHEAIWTN